MKYNDNGTWKDIYVKTLDSLPTGAVIDYDGDTLPDGWVEVDGSGSNANGNYIKYNDGTMICYRTVQFNLNIDIQWGSVYIGENGTQWNFAQEFIEPPSVIIDVKPTSGNSASFIYYNMPTITKTYYKTIAAWRPGALNNVPVSVLIYAIGKWK